ncbi:MAG TPA: response regulator [Candidatus Kryptobacter bacterium]|nr:response regulator [Candidatus Kryptobacter bacterium]
MKALLADDTPMIRRLIEIHLKKFGFEVSTAANGTEALMHLDNSKFDIIMLDLMMPEIDGFEVLRHIRSQGPNRGTPVIILTAFGDVNNVVKAASLGASDFLVKPVDQNVLREKVSNAIGLRLQTDGDAVSRNSADS